MMTKSASFKEAITSFSDDLTQLLLRMLTIKDILMLQATFKGLPDILNSVIDQRCKHECLTTYLETTISAYRMQAPVPTTWKQLYGSFSSLHRLKWIACNPDSTKFSDALRDIKQDNQEYTTDTTNQYLLRCGGHYWFNVWQVSFHDIELVKSEATDTMKALASEVICEEADASISNFTMPLFFSTNAHRVRIQKWDRVNTAGIRPCPRRQHSITCIPNSKCSFRTLVQAQQEPGDELAYMDTRVSEIMDSFDQAPNTVSIRRILIFGGESDTLPYTTYNDLHVLAIMSAADGMLKVKRNNAKNNLRYARWFQPVVTGTAPCRRASHVATLISPNLVLISGGSVGGKPLRSMDVYCLHIEEDHTGLGSYRWSRPLNVSNVPSGRTFHTVTILSFNEVLIFGGHQLYNVKATEEVHYMKLTKNAGYELASWKVVDIAGPRPRPRRGHSTHVIGDKLIVFGGETVIPTKQSLGHPDAYGPLLNDLYILDVQKKRWYLPNIQSGKPPTARKGFRSRCFGTCILISSGFVLSETSDRIERRLPSSDIHILDFCSP